MLLEVTGSGRGLLRSLMSLSTYILNPTPPVIAIGGPTGTGKSKLAVSLASIFRGEVVNADAVQLYEGLTIATNKVSESEAAGVPHHLIGCFPPAFAYCADVHKYRAVCLPTIDKIRCENQRIPFLVGGTHYYLEAILWSDFLASTDKPDSDDLDSIQIPTDLSECYTQLQALNSEVASKLHPKDGRKVRRALREALLHQSDSVNDFLSQPLEQNPHDHPPNRSYQPRYPNQSLFLWLDCDSTVLNERLDARVDQMICSGLVAEFDRFLTDYFREVDLRDEEAQSLVDRSHKLHRLFKEIYSSTQDPFARRGILQSIGFKEFADYLALSPNSGDRDTTRGQKLLAEAIEQVKLATRQYARRQVKWIVNRFLKRPQFGSIPVYRLDTTPTLYSTSPDSIDSWDRHVLAPACRILYEHMVKVGNWTDQFVSDLERFRTLLGYCPSSDCPKQCDFKPLLKEELASPLVCAACDNRVFVRLADFEAHRRSRSHQKRVSKLRRREQMQSVECS
ncbi:hypothetical protein CRM22_000424 [Opisthorchis felineus]|uniref:Uncharacterized protein n=1 Tax=Opisthorchis felineus TaxID=147828 RepID=A0A4S2MFC8_OPIFE|nr:hypothetical protein CRM22_000424 [Opisthorchis felineus]